jgi:hypothetical protein
MTPQLITIQTAEPRGKFAGEVAQAYFVIEDDRVILTDRDGHALHDPDGGDYAQTLGEGDNPKQIAARLLRRFRTKFRSDRVRGFDRPLHYQPLKY